MVPPPVSAQTQVDRTEAQRQIEIIQRQEQERLQREQDALRRRTERVEGIDTTPLQPKIEVPALGAVCRDIAEISIQGAALLPDGERTRISTLFTHRCLTVGDIETLLGQITKYYLDRGYIAARAYLPPQDLSKGLLTVLVIEGVVEKIVIEDGGAKSVSILNVFPGVEGGVLNLRDLEQGIDQINRLSSNSAQLDIQPGDKPGASRVVVRNQPSFPLHASISTDNQGSESTGDKQTGVTATADNVLGFNEMFSATRRESTPNYPGHKYSGSDNFSFSLPFGYNTLSFGSSYSVYESTIRVPSGLDLISSGNSKTDNVRLDRVMYRDQSTRASLAATVTTKKSKNYLDAQLLGVSSRNLTVLDLDSNLSIGFAGGTLTLDLGYAMGLDKAGALKDPNYLPDWAARAQFSKLKVGFNYARPLTLFGQNISFSSQFAGQKANDTLYGSEQISIGGIYSVRGFVKNSLSGDDGYYWRNEFSLRKPLTIGNETISARFYAGYDTGEVRNRTANIPEGHLTGMVLGLFANWRGATWDFFATQPLNLPDNMIKEPCQTWFRVAYSF
jgi:hemolysin activation/secretion protein